MMSRPYQHLVSGGGILFDGLKAVCWFVNMNSDVTNARASNISPGQLYTFVFTQDARGGHVMNWPSNCVNAAAIDPAPNATSVQNFVGNINGAMHANVPPTGRVP